MLSNRFYVVAASAPRIGEWDEFLTLTQVPSSPDRWLCYSTNEDGSEFGYYDVVFKLGQVRMIAGVCGARMPPAGGHPAVAAGNVNWICTPNGARWPLPGVGVLAALIEEASSLGALLCSREDRGDGPPVRADLAGAGPPVLPMVVLFPWAWNHRRPRRTP